MPMIGRAEATPAPNRQRVGWALLAVALLSVGIFWMVLSPMHCGARAALPIGAEIVYEKEQQLSGFEGDARYELKARILASEFAAFVAKRGLYEGVVPECKAFCGAFTHSRKSDSQACECAAYRDGHLEYLSMSW